MNRHLPILLFILSITLTDATEFYGAGSFKSIGSSSRVIALGNTMFSGIISSENMLLNPASIGNEHKVTFHGNMREGDDFFGEYNSFGFTYPFRKTLFTWGMNIINLNIDGLMEYDENGQWISEFESSELYFDLNISSHRKKQAWGLKVSNFYNTMKGGEFQDYSFGLGVGYLVETELKKLSFTESGIDFELKLLTQVGLNGERYFNAKEITSSNYIPTQLRFGSNLVQLNFLNGSHKLQSKLLYDINWRNSYPLEYAWGFNTGYTFNNLIQINFNMGRDNNYFDSKKSEILQIIELEELVSTYSYGIDFIFMGNFLNIGQGKKIAVSFSQITHPYFSKFHYVTLGLKL
tara:strand:+ start:1354 stop:2400 length:1047 start_codon:yes stop_codon:yes gene_type:complete